METNSARDLPSDDDSDDEVPDPVLCRSIKDSSTSGQNLPLTQKRKYVSYYGVPRDKESLLEEVQALQEAFQDQKLHFKAHKEHHNAVQAENSRLQSQIGFLETSGLEAPRTGTRTKLKSKVKGCRARRMELETTCASNAEVVRKLRMDAQFMKTQEATVQRDLFALEVRRLQKSLYHLNLLYKKVCNDNKAAIQLREQIAKLTAKIQELEHSVSMKRKSLGDMATESSAWTAKGAAANTACAADDSRFQSLQKESKAMMDMLFNEKIAKATFTTMVNSVVHELRLAERELQEKARDDALRIA